MSAIQQFTIKATNSAGGSAPFINNEETVEEKMSRRLNILTTVTWFIVSWKLCLNLWSLKWLRPSLNLVISLIPLGLWPSKKEFRESLMKLSISSFKTEMLLDFLRLGFKLFDSIIADGKNEFLKKLCFVLIRRMLPTVLVAYGVLLTEMKLKSYFRCSILKTL